jgi:hypothetical protein
MLGTVLDKITSLVGRALVITAFFPVLLFMTANIGTFTALEGVTEIQRRWRLLDGLEPAVSVGFFLFTIAAAYLLMIINPVFKRLLEGAYPIGFIKDTLLQLQQKKFLKKRDKIQSSVEVLATVRDNREKWDNILKQARPKSSSKLNRTPPQQNSNEFEKVEKELNNLYMNSAQQFEDWRNLSEVIEEVVKHIAHLYELKYPTRQVDRLYDRLVQIWDDMERVAEAKYAEVLLELQSRYAYDEGVAGVRPTNLGNIMAAAWSYPYSRYRIDASAMWPRLQKVIPTDYFRVVEDARISYDFSVVMAFLSILYAIIWIVIPLVTNLQWWLLWIPAIGIFASLLFYAAAIEAARAFGEIFRTCFDLFRFALIQELRMELPPDIKSERCSWDNINHILIFGDRAQHLKYMHTPQHIAPPLKENQPWWQRVWRRN